MKIAVISDIHSNGIILEKAIKDAKSKKVDDFFFLGDMITDGIMDNEVLDIVTKTSSNVILGNRENYIISIIKNDVKFDGFNNIRPLFHTRNHLTTNSINIIMNLPKLLLIEKDNIKFLLIHGDNPSLKSNMDYDKLIEQYDFDVCLSGHIHQIKSILYRGKQFLNPGSIGCPIDSPFYSYGIYDTETKTFTIQKLSTKIDYEKIQSSYLNSSYYEENPEWCNLILVGIKYGKDINEQFVRRIKNQIKNLKTYSADEYNSIWDETYKQIKEEYNI